MRQISHLLRSMFCFGSHCHTSNRGKAELLFAKELDELYFGS